MGDAIMKHLGDRIKKFKDRAIMVIKFNQLRDRSQVQAKGEAVGPPSIQIVEACLKPIKIELMGILGQSLSNSHRTSSQLPVGSQRHGDRSVNTNAEGMDRVQPEFGGVREDVH